jgi:hypothetical protein
MSTRNIIILVIIVLLGIVGLTYCVANIIEPTPTQPSQDAIYTSAAQTVIAQATFSAGETAIAQLTQIAQVTSTPTVVVPSPTVPTATVPTATVPSPTPVTPTNTSVPPSPTSPPFTPTATPIPCDWAQFVGDVSVPDGSEFPPNTVFTKTWRLKNIGSCTWTPDYDLVFVNGSQMGGNSVNPLNANVRPGESIDLSITLTSPANEGNYTGNWALRNASGLVFGVGAAQNQPFCGSMLRHSTRSFMI